MLRRVLLVPGTSAMMKRRPAPPLALPSVAK